MEEGESLQGGREKCLHFMPTGRGRKGRDSGLQQWEGAQGVRKSGEKGEVKGKGWERRLPRDHQVGEESRPCQNSGIQPPPLSKLNAAEN